MSAARKLRTPDDYDRFRMAMGGPDAAFDHSESERIINLAPIVTRAAARAAARAAGLKRYFTGKSCPHGHTAPRLTRNGACLMCAQAINAVWKRAHPEQRKAHAAKHYSVHADTINAASAAYRRANPEKIKLRRAAHYLANSAELKAKGAAHRLAHRDETKARDAAYYLANSEKIKARASAWLKAFPERARAQGIAYWRAHPEKFKAFKARYYRAHLEEAKAFKAKRRARKNNAEGRHTRRDIAALYVRQDGRCAFNQDHRFEVTGYHLDHILALAKGGSNWPDNLQLLCPTCNLRKGTKNNEVARGKNV